MFDILLQAEGGPGMNLMPFYMIAIVAVFYFFFLRPQQKKQKDEVSFVQELKKGSKVVTAGGIHGKIVQVNEENNTILLEIAEGTKIKIDKQVISMEFTKAANAPKED